MRIVGRWVDPFSGYFAIINRKKTKEKATYKPNQPNPRRDPC